MLQIKNILFPTDYSVSAEHAFSQAAYLAERYNATLHVLHVADPVPSSSTVQPLQFSEADVAEELRLSLEEPSTPFQSRKQIVQAERPREGGSVSYTILAYAEDHDIDVIVMGTHGRSGAERLLMGSVASQVVRLATCPVFTIRHDARVAARGSILRILVPVDFSEHAYLAATYATDLAATYGAHLDLIHVIEETALPTIYGIEPMVVQIPDVEQEAQKALDHIAETARQAGVSVKIHVHIGHPSRDIIDFAASDGADLIVMATHGLTGLKRFFLGSVAEKIVQHAPCPVFTVKGFGKDLRATPTKATVALASP